MVGNAIRIAVLDADVPVPAVRSVRGLYSDIFAELLHKASAKNSTSSSTQFSFQPYDVVAGDYPTSLDDLDGILITGSSASAYDNQPWIKHLNTFIQQVFTTYPHIRFFGSCFGHQILCQAILGPHGAQVTRDPNGWELGVHDVALTPEFLTYTTKSTTTPSATTTSKSSLPQSLKFQFVHADHVLLPPGCLPPGWMILGSSPHCAVQGVLLPDRVLTFQGHFEFDRFVNSETIRVFGALWDEQVLARALSAVDADDDAEIAAAIAAEFLAGGRAGARARATSEVLRFKRETGLLTPPEED